MLSAVSGLARLGRIGKLFLIILVVNISRAHGVCHGRYMALANKK